MQKNIADLSREELLEIPGIGKDLADKIEEYLKTGKVASYEDLKKRFPKVLLISFLCQASVRKQQNSFTKTENKNIDELEKFAREHKLAGLPGIKEKTEENIIRGIEMLRRAKKGSRWEGSCRLPLILSNTSRKMRPVKKISIAGSLRRMKDTVKDIDILITSSSPHDVMKAFVHLPDVKEVLMHGPQNQAL